ncbi:MAG: class IV adenylate cyclase [Ignavibacteria bacterium]|nr:class IV adenylate cyclase [Ignavibacteria bacterium]
MPSNIEIKARIESIDALLPRVRSIATSGPEEIFQDDTFFPCPSGRLKLRMFSEDAGELIFYQRTDSAGPKQSRYILTHTSEPAALRETLTQAYGTAGRVRKHRTLYLAGRTRVHLDRVDGLGEFLELEVVLADGEAPETGIAVANELLAALGITLSFSFTFALRPIPGACQH